MPTLVSDCPRCHARKMTFDCFADVYLGSAYSAGSRSPKLSVHEVFSVCRSCDRPTIFKLKLQKPSDRIKYSKSMDLATVNANLNSSFRVEGFVSVKDKDISSPPDHLPEDVNSAFSEGSVCLANGCFNAAATMFRLALDLATKPMLPPKGSEGAPSPRIRRNLGLRLPWLFERKILPEALSELAQCVKDDGNDGAHQGTIKQADAADLEDFTRQLFLRMYTEPENLRLAVKRKDARRCAAEKVG